MLYIAPYKMFSEGAKALASKLNILRVDATKRFKPNDLIVNWGNTDISQTKGSPRILNAKTLNAKNKLNTLRVLTSEGVSTLEFTRDSNEAKRWIDQGEFVYARTVLDGHSGAGIAIMNSITGFTTTAPLYTKGVIGASEYRVHVFNRKAIDIQKKKRRAENESDGLIKNLDNGWVFCRENITAPKSVYDTAIKAVSTLGLDFGAVDIIWSTSHNKSIVLEVNTAPGLEGTTLDRYAEAIRSVYEV